MEKITKDTKIEEVLQKYPQTAEVFVKHGFHCLGCAAASFESIKEGAEAHGITVDELIEDLNKAIEKK
jgi:hybrid cluster-associated redox disulfide protein